MLTISVVIPTFNRRTQVLEAVASVLAQTSGVSEILVVDDGSTDDTSEHLSRLGPPVRYVRTTNQGVSAARNHGILVATGDWIAFLDSDDEWHPGKLARQIECVRSSGAVVCFTGCDNEEGERLDDLARMDASLSLGGSKVYPPANSRFFEYSRHPYVQSMLVKKNILMGAGLFDQTLRVAEDTKLIYRLVMVHGYSVVNDPLVRICRKRETSGLSDDNEPRAAARRFECYTRVQAEFYWTMLSLNPKVARILRSNHGYFVSRWAELAAVLGDVGLARSLGREGLCSGGNIKSRIRSLLIFVSPRFFKILVCRKWKV